MYDNLSAPVMGQYNERDQGVEDSDWLERQDSIFESIPDSTHPMLNWEQFRTKDGTQPNVEYFDEMLILGADFDAPFEYQRLNADAKHCVHLNNKILVSTLIGDKKSALETDELQGAIADMYPEAKQCMTNVFSGRTGELKTCKEKIEQMIQRLVDEKDRPPDEKEQAMFDQIARHSSSLENERQGIAEALKVGYNCTLDLGVDLVDEQPLDFVDGKAIFADHSIGENPFIKTKPSADVQAVIDHYAQAAIDPSRIGVLDIQKAE